MNLTDHQVAAEKEYNSAFNIATDFHERWMAAMEVKDSVSVALDAAESAEYEAYLNYQRARAVQNKRFEFYKRALGR